MYLLLEYVGTSHTTHKHNLAAQPPGSSHAQLPKVGHTSHLAFAHKYCSIWST